MRADRLTFPLPTPVAKLPLPPSMAYVLVRTNNALVGVGNGDSSAAHSKPPIASVIEFLPFAEVMVPVPSPSKHTFRLGLTAVLSNVIQATRLDLPSPVALTGPLN
jgi:hypothetical protein